MESMGVKLQLQLALLVSLAVNSVDAKKRSATELIIRPLSAERCTDMPGLAMAWANASLRMEGRTGVVMDIDAFFSRPAKSLQRLSVNKVQCIEAVSSNTCSHPKEWTFQTGVCSMLTTPLMPWTPILTAMRPSFKCPVQAGNYSGHKIAFDTRVAKTFAGQTLQPGVVHVVKGALYDQDLRPFACLKVMVDVIRVRKGSNK